MSMGKYGQSKMTACDDAKLQAKRINQIKFILKQRLKDDYIKKVDIIAGRQLVNILETKQGAIYCLPAHMSKSDSLEMHKLH